MFIEFQFLYMAFWYWCTSQITIKKKNAETSIIFNLLINYPEERSDSVAIHTSVERLEDMGLSKSLLNPGLTYRPCLL